MGLGIVSPNSWEYDLMLVCFLKIFPLRKMDKHGRDRGPAAIRWLFWFIFFPLLYDDNVGRVVW